VAKTPFECFQCSQVLESLQQTFPAALLVATPPGAPSPSTRSGASTRRQTWISAAEGGPGFHHYSANTAPCAPSVSPLALPLPWPTLSQSWPAAAGKGAPSFSTAPFA